jgi:4-amino-4-deoxy-L-arabinose transferase-like glycosyltransferase
MKGRPGSAIALLFVFVLALSALVQSMVVSRTVVNKPLRVDALDYFSYGVNLRNHGIYSLDREWMVDPGRVPRPDSVRPPGYALFLLALDPVVSWDWLRRLGYVQSIFAVGTVALVFLLGRRFLDPGWALFAAFLTAICPSLVVMSTYVLSETLFGFLLAAAILVTMSAMRTPGATWTALLAGFAWGVASLVRPTSQFLPLLFVLLALLVPILAVWRRAAVLCLLGFVLAMAPWMVRNHGLPPQGEGRSLMVKALAHGSYPDFKYEDREDSYGYPYHSDPAGADRSRDLPSVLRYIAADFRAHPLRMARWYLVGKPVAFLSWADPQSWDIFIYAVNRSPYFESRWLNLSWRAMSALHAPLAVLAVMGGLLALGRRRSIGATPDSRSAAALVALVFAYAIAFHMVVAPFPRYNVPFRPLMFLLASLALQGAWQALPAWRRIGRAPASGSEKHG